MDRETLNRRIREQESLEEQLARLERSWEWANRIIKHQEKTIRNYQIAFLLNIAAVLITVLALWLLN